MYVFQCLLSVWMFKFSFFFKKFIAKMAHQMKYFLYVFDFISGIHMVKSQEKAFMKVR